MTDTAIALGSFDGLHIGHIEVLRSANSCETAVALAFSVPPSMVMSGKKELLLPPDKKRSMLEEIGLSVEEMSFEDVRNTEPLDFLLGIYERFKPKKICCGFNFRFGKNAAGDIALLRVFCEERGITLSVTPPVEQDGERVSSSRIRALISDGHLEKAEKLLSRPFTIEGRVQGGDRRGRSLGFPTANFYYPDDLVIPRHGVYAATCPIDGRTYKAISYIGFRPTFSLERVIVETYLLDFEGDLYDRELKVELRRFIREDRKFSSADELKKQIALDIESAKI